MTGSDRKYYMRLLHAAKQGDDVACERLTAGLAKEFGYMIRGFGSVDPAFDRDDLALQFQIGIWRAIAKVDDRGDPLFHLAWRGRKAVSSMLKVIKQRRHGTEEWVRDFGEERSLGTLPEGFDLPDTRPEAEVDYEVVAAETKQEINKHVAYLIEHATLTTRQREAVGVMMTLPDVVDGAGANLRLARLLGITPQAASVMRRRVFDALAGQQRAYEQVIRCPHCGGEFGSKGALTQHKRGQSGHRPCVPSA